MNHTQDRRAFWHTHWTRCRALGMTLKDYAAQEGLTLTVFYGWSKRFKRETMSGSSFSRVTVTAATPVQYRLCFPNGLVLEWHGEADTEQLSRLARQLI